MLNMKRIIICISICSLFFLVSCKSNDNTNINDNNIPEVENILPEIESAIPLDDDVIIDQDDRIVEANK